MQEKTATKFKRVTLTFKVPEDKIEFIHIAINKELREGSLQEFSDYVEEWREAKVKEP